MSKGNSGNVGNVFNPEGITPRQAGFLGTLLKTKVFEADFGFEVEDFGEVLTFGEIIESFNPEGIRVNGVAGSTYEAFGLMTMEEAKPFISWLCQCPDKPKASTKGGWKGKSKTSAPSAPQSKGAVPAKPVAPKGETSLLDLTARGFTPEQIKLMLDLGIIEAPAEPVATPPAKPEEDRIDRLEALVMAVLEAQTAPTPAKPEIIFDANLGAYGEAVAAPQPSAGHQMVTVENGMAVKLPNGEVVQLVLNENGSLRSRKNFAPVS